MIGEIKINTTEEIFEKLESDFSTTGRLSLMIE
jgi:hypothetical protein